MTMTQSPTIDYVVELWSNPSGLKSKPQDFPDTQMKITSGLVAGKPCLRAYPPLCSFI